MKTVFQALRYFLFMSVLLGVVYPIALTGIAQLFFPDQANGSLIKRADQVIGSALLSQAFKDPKHFWPRPSAVDYNPTSSGASNLGPTNLDLKNKIAERNKQGLQGDLVFASGSGLDPHISPKDAELQMERIAEARHYDSKQREALKTIVNANTENRQFGIFGEPRVNVLKVNLALDHE